jgi:hypothetical protein
MRYLKNEDGVALITALMFTLICLAMVMSLMYYVLTATRMSAGQKKYRNSLEASYGGTEFVTKTVIPRLFSDYSSGKTSLQIDFGSANLDLQFGADAALKDKLSKATGAWGGGVSKTVDPKVAPDFVFTLKGQGSAGDFKVYSKIVDTISGVGLIVASGIEYLDPVPRLRARRTSTRSKCRERLPPIRKRKPVCPSFMRIDPLEL